MYDTIVLPVDGSEFSMRAAEHAVALARRYGSAVHVITVVDVQRAAGLFSAGGIDEAFVEQVEAAGRESLEAVEELVAEADDVQSTIVQGPPWKAPSAGIIEYATEQDADLIVMGTHGRTGLRRALAGSVTEQVVRLADVPVLTVGAPDGPVTSDYERILVPTDGSEPAAAAVDHALSIARTYDASVHVLFVIDIGSLAMASDVAPYIAMRDELETKGENATASVVTRAEEAGLDAVADLREGFPPGSILEYVADHDIDLIVMGTHGRTGLDRVLLGSTAARVIRRAEVPVFSVKPDETDGGEETEQAGDENE